MKYWAPIFAAFVIVVVGRLGFAGTNPPEQTMLSGGMDRTYALYVPPSVASKGPVPLLVVLHGHFGTGPDAMTRYHLEAEADRYGFIVVAPDGIKREWNDGRSTKGMFANTNVDDVGFISNLVAKIRSQYSVDPRRIYVAGMSNGAMMAQVLGCKRSDLFAGVASVAGSLPVETVCTPTHPISVMLVDGTGDPVVPYGGGPIAHRGNQSSVIGAERTTALWVADEHCSATPVRAHLPDVDPTDGTTISTAIYSGCTGGNQVALYTVNGGGHEWPGGIPNRFIPLGKLNNDINATDTIWRFFAAHSK